MQLTIDSSESLEDAMRVLGALYGVRLVLATGNEVTPQRAVVARATPAADRPERATRARTTRTARRKSGKTAPARRRRASKQAVVPTSTADIRTWARQNGLTVSDRGRISSSVLSAYRDAHAG